MKVKMNDGNIVNIPDELTPIEQKRYLQTYHIKPGIGTRVAGNLLAGAGKLSQDIGNIYGLIGAERGHEDFSKLGDLLSNFQSARTVSAQPAESIPGQIGEGLVRFAPELPLWYTGESAIFATAKAIPKVKAVAKALEAVRGDTFFKEWGKAIARAGITGAGVGAVTAEPDATGMERTKHAGEEGLGFALGVAGLHPFFKLLGVMAGRGLKKAVEVRDKAKPTTEDVAEVLREAEAAKEKGDTEIGGLMDEMRNLEEAEKKRKADERRRKETTPPEDIPPVEATPKEGEAETPPTKTPTEPPTEPLVEPKKVKFIKTKDGKVLEVDKETDRFYYYNDATGGRKKIRKTSVEEVPEEEVGTHIPGVGEVPPVGEFPMSPVHGKPVEVPPVEVPPKVETPPAGGPPVKDYSGPIEVEYTEGRNYVEFGYIKHHFPKLHKWLEKNLPSHAAAGDAEKVSSSFTNLWEMQIPQKIRPETWKGMPEAEVEELLAVYREASNLNEKMTPAHFNESVEQQISNMLSAGTVTENEAQVMREVLNALKTKPNFELLFGEKTGRSYGVWNSHAGRLASDNTYTLLHELGHWGYDMVLTTEERITVMRNLVNDLKSGLGGKQNLLVIYPGLQLKGGVAALNNYASLGEIFAEMFRQHVLKNANFPLYMKAITKVKKLYGYVANKLRYKGYEPSYMKEAFNKIIDANKLKVPRGRRIKDLSTVPKTSPTEQRYIRNLARRPIEDFDAEDTATMADILIAMRHTVEDVEAVTTEPVATKVNKRRRKVEKKVVPKTSRMDAIKEAAKKAKDRRILEAEAEEWERILAEEGMPAEPGMESLEDIRDSELGATDDAFIGVDGTIRELDFEQSILEVKQQTFKPSEEIDPGLPDDVQLPQHYKQFRAWMKKNALRPKSESGYQAAWKLYQEFGAKADAAQPETPMGKLYKELRRKISDKARMEHEAKRTLVEIQGEDGGTQKVMTDIGENDIMPYLKNYLTSPFTWAKQGPPKLMEQVVGFVKGQMVARYETNMHNTLINELEGLLKSPEARNRIRDILEGKKKPTNEVEAEVAIRVKDWLGTMRTKYQNFLRKSYMNNLSKKQNAALTDLLLGESPAEVAKRYKMKTDTIEDIAKEFKAIDSWGLDDYVTKMERGNLALVTEEGDLIGWAMSPKHGRDLGIAYLKANPGTKTIYLSTRRPFEGAIGVSRAHYYTIQNKMVEEMTAYADEIKKGMVKAAARKTMPKVFTVKPTLKFSPYAQPTKGKLRGEQNLFPLLRSYAHSMELKMQMDPLITDARNLVPELPPNLRSAFLDLIEDAKGKYYAEDKLADAILNWVSVKSGGKLDAPAMAATQLVGKIKMTEAYAKFAYRPIAGIINWASGSMHIWVKTSFDMMVKGKKWLRTEEGMNFIKEVRPMLGVDIVEHMTEGGSISFKTKVGRRSQIGEGGGITQYLRDIAHPMGFFQRPEGPLRELCAATNYLLALDKGASKEAAKEFAIRNVWFQEFTYNTAALPKILRSPTGRLVGQFKPYLVKEIEFIASLSGPELAKYSLAQVLLGGPRGFLYLIRSLPFIGGFGAWNEIEAWLDTKAPQTSRGLGGFLGVDITAPAVFQFPSRFEDWMGPFFSDLKGLHDTVVKPLMKGESFGPMQTMGSPWTKAPTEVKEWAESVVPILRHWDNIFEQMVDKDGWVKNDRGQKMFHIGDSAYEHMAFYMKTAVGAESLESSITRRAQSRAGQERIVRNANKSKIMDSILDTLQSGEGLTEDQLGELVEYGITSSSLRRTLKFRTLDPGTREFLRTELLRRYQLLDEWPTFEGHPAGARRRGTR